MDANTTIPSWLRRHGRRAIRPALAVGVAIAVFVALRVSGSITDTDQALQLMGFDPDRSQLLADLVAGAVIVAIATLVTRAPVVSGLAGMVAMGVLFRHTFAEETRLALGASGPLGRFDPGGWVLTLATLATSFLIVAWVAAILALIVRRALLAAADDARAAVRGERTWRRVGRPAATVAIGVLLFVTVPVFGDMVNFAPDVRMRIGGPPPIGLTQTGGPAAAVASPLPADVLDHPTLIPGTSESGAPPGQSVLSTQRPWTAWQPQGQGTLLSHTFPAPWIGGTSTQAGIDLYLPPGYATSQRSYPVIYEVPWRTNGGWSTAVHISSMLDTLIDTGAMPASIVAFVSDYGGPFSPSQCADSVDHREWFERYLVTTVVPWVDATYRTIRTGAARSLLGFSYGGFCAPMLALRNPDVFSTALAISGFYQAGIQSNETPNAWRPFGGKASAEAAYSPIDLAAKATSDAAKRLLFVVVGQPGEPFFGPQYGAFAAALRAGGLNADLVPTMVGHSWIQVRDVLPNLFQTLGERQAALGVFR